MATATEIEKKSSIILRLGKSQIVWLLILLPLLDFGCRVIKPLQFISLKNFRPIEFDSWVSKFPPYLDSKQRPDVLIVGSSLPMAAFALADDKFAKGRKAEDQDSLRTYTEADEFKKGLAEKLGTSAKVENFSCAGGMVSDTYIFLKRLIDEDRIPRMVLYGISPRDFVDNMMPPLGQSPLFEVISDWSFELPKAGMSANQYVSYVCANYSYYYKTRRKHKSVLTAITADALGRPINLFKASTNKSLEKSGELSQKLPCETKHEEPTSGNPLEADLQCYRKRYTPLNTNRFDSESKYLKKLVSLCKKHKILLVFISMPLTERNRQLIPPQLATAYASAIENAQGNSLVKWLDMTGPGTFSPKDFSDSAHLNRDGSIKFQKLLLEKMAAQAIKPMSQSRN